MGMAKVLIVEDQRIVALDIKNSLERLGYLVVGSTASGDEALKIVEINPPDIILMDIILKGEMDGIETATIVRQKYHIPVVYLTSYSDEKTLQRALLTEPHGYILKP